MNFDQLTEPQQRLLIDAEQAEDSGEYLRTHLSASPADKAVVAEALGGPGSGEEFAQ